MSFLRPSSLLAVLPLAAAPALAAPSLAGGPSLELPGGLLFEANGGRYGGEVAFSVRGPGYQLFLAPDEHVMALQEDGGDRYVGAIRTRFVGADAAAQVVGEGLRPTRIHHFRGKDPSGWSTGNRTYAAVRHRSLWPGVDLVAYDAGGEVELDFVVAAGSDPARVRFAFDGVEDARIAASGELVLATAAGPLELSAPVAYQESGALREDVPVRFQLEDDGSVGFELGSFDASRELVIDPVLAWSTYLAGTSNDELTDVATDAAGNVYVCGNSSSVDLPQTTGAFQDAPAAYRDAIVAKLDARGQTLEWVSYLGGSIAAAPLSTWADDHAWAIDVNAAGDVFVGGATSTEDFPTTPGAYDTSYSLGYDLEGFVAKLSSDGATLHWSTYLGDTGHDEVFGLAATSGGKVVVVGEADNKFPTSTWVGDVPPAGSTYPFVARFDATGASLDFCTSFVGDNGTGGFGWKPSGNACDVALDSSGRIYVAGVTNTSDFPLVNGHQASWGGGFGNDAWLARLSPDASTIEYSTYFGGADGEIPASRIGIGVAAADDGRAWFLCRTKSSDFPVKNAWNPSYSGNWTLAAACVDTNASGASSLLWSTYLGRGTAFDVEVDADANAWVLGFTNSTGFPTVDPWKSDQDGGASDLVLTAFDPLGVPFFSTYFGGSGADPYSSNDLARLTIAPDGSVLVAGPSGSSDAGTLGSAHPTSASAAPLTSGVVARFTAPSSNAAYLVRVPCAGGDVPQDSLVPLSGALLGHVLSVRVADPTGEAFLNPGAISLFYASLSAAPGYPCGLPLPDFGLGGAPGELLILPKLILLGGVQPIGPQTEAVHAAFLPDDPLLDGLTLYTQGLILDPTPGTMPQEIRFLHTEGLDLTLGR